MYIAADPAHIPLGVPLWLDTTRPISGDPLRGLVVAQDKARSAAAFRRPSKAFQDMVAAGGEGLQSGRRHQTPAASRAPKRSGRPAARSKAATGAASSTHVATSI